jgi:hypothetical protein
MERKDLCSSCVKSEDCVFSGKLPVWECEEHSFGESKVGKAKNTRIKYATVSAEEEE